MSTYWNFREILAIDPIDKCAGTAITKNRKCRNPVNAYNRERAENILDKMNKQKRVSSDLFDDLADAMLCRGQHNHKDKESINQVSAVSYAWQLKFKEYRKKDLKRRQSTRRALSIKLDPDVR